MHMLNIVLPSMWPAASKVFHNENMWSITISNECFFILLQQQEPWVAFCPYTNGSNTYALQIRCDPGVTYVCIHPSKHPSLNPSIHPAAHQSSLIETHSSTSVSFPRPLCPPLPSSPLWWVPVGVVCPWSALRTNSLVNIMKHLEEAEQPSL